MITTIRQRIYLFGLLPLGALAVSLVLLNGFSRINDANRELETSQEVTAALLQGPALDALVVGDIFHFEQAVRAVRARSPALTCVLLSDATQRTISRAGRCEKKGGRMAYFQVREPTKGLSDYEERSGAGLVMGQMGLVMDDLNIVRKRREILLQLCLSLLLIGAVLAATGRSLRSRLIAPIERIGSAMHALSQRDYATRLPIGGNDELTRLAQAINNTISTIEEYTRELERRRNEANQALQDADAANLTRDGLVRSLTEDLAEPMSTMHSELTAMAMENKDPELKERIKRVMAALQGAQSDFADLIEIAARVELTRSAPWLDATEMWADIERDIHRLSEIEAIPVNFVVTQMASKGSASASTLLLNLDGVRLKKAMLYLVRALGRPCKNSKDSGVHVNAELIRFAADRLHVSVHIVAFYEAGPSSFETRWTKGLSATGNGLAAIAGLTDREAKIIEYLLRAIGSTPTVSISGSGAVNVFLDVTCSYSIESSTPHGPTDWMFAAAPISAALVSNDLSLLRYTTRGDMSNHDLKLITFAHALSSPGGLQGQDALLIDISDDLGDVLRLLDVAKVQDRALPPLIAICPPGVVSDSLTNHLFELGFVGMLQKPLQYSRLIEVIRTTLAHPLKDIDPRQSFSPRHGTPE